LPLNDSAAAQALALDNAPIAMQLAVLESTFGTKKHAESFLKIRRPHKNQGRHYTQFCAYRRNQFLTKQELKKPNCPEKSKKTRE
jgi:hypothetical protein